MTAGPSSPPALGGPRERDGAGRGTNGRGAWGVAAQRRATPRRAAPRRPLEGAARMAKLVLAGEAPPPLVSAGFATVRSSSPSCQRCLHGTLPQPFPSQPSPSPRRRGFCLSLLLSTPGWPPQPPKRWLQRLFHLRNHPFSAGSYAGPVISRELTGCWLYKTLF